MESEGPRNDDPLLQAIKAEKDETVSRPLINENHSPLTIKKEAVEITSELPSEEDESDSSTDEAPSIAKSTKSFRCYVCSTSVLLDSKDRLSLHLETAHPEQQAYHCGECNLTVYKIETFNQHLSRHDASSRPYKCRFCSLRFREHYRRNQHESRKHGGDDRGKVVRGSHSCSFCEKKFVCKWRLKEHERNKHGKEGFGGTEKCVLKCYLCLDDTVLESKSALHQHLVGNHALLDKYYCNECDYFGEKITSYNLHLSQHDPNERPFKCSVCSLRFKTLHSKLDHEVSAHKLNNGKIKKQSYRESQKNLSCSTCGKKFPFKCYLKRHELTAHRAEPITETKGASNKCYLCTNNTCFDNRNNLLNHLESTHPVQSKYQCTECDYSTKQIITFNHHLVRHDPITRPYKCSFCALRYSTREAKMQHEVQAHDGSGHSCSDCGKKFACQSRLVLHERVKRHGSHANPSQNMEQSTDDSKAVEKLTCTICDKTFTNQSTKTQHERFVHNVRSNSEYDTNPLQCYLCGTETILESRRAFIKHLSNVHPSQPMYKCTSCTYTTRTKTDFNSHNAKHYITSPSKPRFEVQYHAGFEIKTEVQDEYHDQAIPNSVDKKFRCYLCEKEYYLDSREVLLQHLVSGHPQQDVYQCGRCHFSVDIITIFNQHLAQHAVIPVKRE